MESKSDKGELSPPFLRRWAYCDIVNLQREYVKRIQESYRIAIGSWIERHPSPMFRHPSALYPLPRYCDPLSRGCSAILLAGFRWTGESRIPLCVAVPRRGVYIDGRWPIDDWRRRVNVYRSRRIIGAAQGAAQEEASKESAGPIPAAMSIPVPCVTCLGNREGEKGEQNQHCQEPRLHTAPPTSRQVYTIIIALSP